MGKPNHVNHDYLAQARSIPGEVKHLSNQRKRNRIDTVSSGERKRHSLNRCIASGISNIEFLNSKQYQNPKLKIWDLFRI